MGKKIVKTLRMKKKGGSDDTKIEKQLVNKGDFECNCSMKVAKTTKKK